MGMKKILKTFDFERVQKAMIALNWRYFDGPPTTERLRETAEDLLKTVKKGSIWASTGGFTAFRTDAGDIGLRFCIDEIDDE